jgi:Ca2+-binding RTX toxin-like protein
VVAVDQGADENATHGFVIQPFTDITRDGFRVRQDAFGVATITTSDPDCFANAVVNDVVCNGARGSLNVTMRGGADRVTLRGDNASGDVCFAGGVTAPVILATVALGGGDDVFTVEKSPPCAPGTATTGQADWGVTVDGEAGADRILGGSRDDTLLGGTDAVGVVNDLEGGGGNDLLRGSNRRDLMDGGAGDDTLRGGDGRDSFFGGEGDDLLHGGLNGDGPDTFLGGAGTDTVTYAFAGSVTVTIFDPTNPTASEAPDGQPGENDTVQGDVENVTGGGNNDTLTGNNLANRIDGSLGDDTINGGAGRDVLLGGEGNDGINSRDGEFDPLIDCGPGTRDSATIDLVDRPRPGGRINPFGSPVNCETVFSFATDDGPPGRLAQGVLRRDAAGIARVLLTCPRNARVTCRGTLRLRQPKAPRRILRSVRYAVPRGTTGEIPLGVPAALRGKRAVLETREKGVSRKGPRGVVRTVRIR